MSAAATAVDAAPPPKGKKKLIIIIAAVLVLVLAGGGAALMMMKKASADTEEGAEADEAPAGKKAAVAKRDPKALPVFVPLDPFTVNLADRNADRYAQVAVTLELEDAALEAQLKAYMPAVRNNILLAISDRTAGELLARDGKKALAQRIRRETSRALGYELPSEEELQAADEEAADDEPPRKKRRKPAEPELPIRAVHFGNFIIQ